MNGDARYPIGSFQPVEELSPDERVREIDFLAAAPGLTRDAVEGLTGDQLDTAYREGGWTARQVVHHLADSHTNAHLRMRLILTEEPEWAGRLQVRDAAAVLDYVVAHRDDVALVAYTVAPDGDGFSY